MLLTPRYDGPPVLRVDTPVDELATALLRQRRRLAEVLEKLDAGQWAAQSRCADWSVQDVVAHLIRTNQVWEMSITAGRDGAPTRAFSNFDPASSPHRMVEAMRGRTSADLLARYVQTTESLAAVMAAMDEQAWSLTGESPLGHVTLQVVALHALWDCWVHERDVLLPLDLQPVEEADEVVACLRYAAGVGPALLALNGSTRRGTLAVEATEPQARLVVEAGPSVVVRDGAAPTGAVRLTGRAVDLVEGLSCRTPLTSDVATADRWLVEGVATAFDAAPG